MKRLLGLLGMTGGATIGLLGLLFIVGWGGQVRRLVVAAILLAIATMLILLGSRQVRAARQASREVLVPELLRLAELGSGVLTEADVLARLGERAVLGMELLREMAARGDCRREARDGVVAFVFPELEPRLVIRRCRYCGFESPIAGAVTNEPCPRCGGAPELVRTS
jgi:hypothetical protein